MAFADDGLAHLRRTAAGAWADGLAGHLARGQEAGWVARELPARETAAWLASMLLRVLHEVVPRARDAELDVLLDTGAELLWATVYAPPGARTRTLP